MAPMNVHITVKLEEDDEVVGSATMNLVEVITQADGHRHGSYLLHVNLESHRVFGQYTVARIRLPDGGSVMRVTDRLPPRAGQEWRWDPERGWHDVPIGPLDWVEERVLLWAFGLDEVLDDVVLDLGSD